MTWLPLPLRLQQGLLSAVISNHGISACCRPLLVRQLGWLPCARPCAT